MFPLVEDMSEIYAHPLPRVCYFSVCHWVVSQGSGCSSHSAYLSIQEEQGRGGGGADYSMANRKIAYTLGRGRAYFVNICHLCIFIQFDLWVHLWSQYHKISNIRIYLITWMVANKVGGYSRILSWTVTRASIHGVSLTRYMLMQQLSDWLQLSCSCTLSEIVERV